MCAFGLFVPIFLVESRDNGEIMLPSFLLYRVGQKSGMARL